MGTAGRTVEVMCRSPQPSRLKRIERTMVRYQAASLRAGMRGLWVLVSKRPRATFRRTRYTTVRSNQRTVRRWRVTVRSRSQTPQRAQKSLACTGPRITGSYGASATIAFALGGHNVSAGVVISRPLVNDSFNPLKGVQIGLTGQWAGMAGFGLFAGIADQFSAGLSTGPLTSGPSTSAYAEGDFGDEAAVGGSIQGNQTSLSGAVSGKIGPGAGVFGGAGVAKSYTLVTKPLGC